MSAAAPGARESAVELVCDGGDEVPDLAGEFRGDEVDVDLLMVAGRVDGVVVELEVLLGLRVHAEDGFGLGEEPFSRRGGEED